VLAPAMKRLLSWIAGKGETDSVSGLCLLLQYSHNTDRKQG
jgi:hypothetical protein